jgi:Pyridoxamine 5'-phosphate oxidase
MGTVLAGIDYRLRKFIEEQHVYFIGTAPAATDGHVNISPKGYADTFAVVDESTVAYVDLTGSGAESIAHIRENGRIVVMFCAFEGSPRIVRLHGTARVITQDDTGWDAHSGRFPTHPGARAIVIVDVQRVSSSCGTAVPVLEFVQDRDQLLRSTSRKSAEELAEYHRTRNSTSIDGLDALPQPKTRG